MWPFSRLKRILGTSNSSQGDLDRLYSISRRLLRRVQTLEANQAIMKRDLARVDRRGYREAEAESVVEEPEAVGLPSPQQLIELYNRRG